MATALATTAANIAAAVAAIETKVQAFVQTAEGVQIVGELAPLFAVLGQQLAAEFSTTSMNFFATVETDVVSAEQTAVLKLRAAQARLFADLANAFHPAPAGTVPPAA